VDRVLQASRGDLSQNSSVALTKVGASEGPTGLPVTYALCLKAIGIDLWLAKR
jgi:hypothetical protein